VIEFVTERLRLRPLEADDVEELWRLDSDPQVMRFFGTGPARDREAHRERLLRVLADYDQSPLGFWSIRAIEDDRFLGIALLVRLEGGADVEIGYRLAPEAWGQGIATEAGRALLRYAFGALHIGRIVAVTHPDNLASRRVLAKLGLDYLGDAFHYGQTVAYYALDRADGRPAAAQPVGAGPA
jgi:ribosomal-protein-alanine N-acetyltransferase